MYSAYFLLILAELWLEMRHDLAQAAHAAGPLAPLYRLLLLGWRPPAADHEALVSSHRSTDRWLRVMGLVGVPLAIAFHGGVGALFATLASRPYWHHSLFPILFLTGALVSGGALLLALVAALGRPDDPELPDLLRLLGRIVLGLVALDLLLEWSETSIPMWYGVGEDYALYREILFGRFWYVFWVVHLALGSAVPVALLLWRPAARWAAGLAGALVAVTFLAVRLNLVIPGQVTPALEGLREAYVDQRLRFEYVPSLYEWSVVAGVLALGMLAFAVGTRALPILRALQQLRQGRVA
jgi:molybdopterin-containing oxidoreductase family membrane subunit